MEAKKAEMKSEKRVKIRKRERLVITVLFAILALNVCVGCASAATYTVCPSGCNYISIQAAINATDPGETIEVHSGTYYEHVNVNKQLILKGVGTGSGKPVVDSGGNGSAITLSANGITFEGFTVTNSGNLYGDVGIKVTSTNNTITGNTASNNGYSICLNDSCNNTITGNNASNNDYGIYLNDSCNNNISGNTVSNNCYGIYLNDSCNNNTISGNIASNNNGDGIYLSSSSNNTITENNAGNNGDGICISSSSNNNRIIGNNASGSNHGAGIRFRRSNNNTIIGNTASNNWDGIYISSSSNNTITGNSVSNNFDGIIFRDSNNNTITGNNVSNNALGIVLSSSSNNNTITGNVFVNDGLFGGYQNMVKDNTVNGKPLVYLIDASDYTVEDAGQVILVNCTNITVENLDLSHTSMGIILLNTKDSKILNNTAGNNLACGIYLSSSCDNTLKRNNVSSNLCGIGISISHSRDNTITGNNASNNEGGISLTSSCNNTITGNNANNNLDGISLSSSCNNTITGNNASNNWYGISLRYSSNNIIATNTASNNNWYGIILRDSRNNTIKGNTASNNRYGIWPGHSNSNKNYFNIFINNTNNVYSFNSTNVWNSTDEITYTYNGSTYTNYLGNYWSDYKEKYPEAEEINGYGIWDMQYSIGADRDNYPLIQPWENYFAPTASVFDTGAGTYPSIMGTHTGTITPSSSINVSKLYTYPCAKTGGHTESIKLEENGTVIANGTWDGYHEDWHNITLYNVTDGTHYVTLLQDHEYSYTIRTGSYPQILHAASKEVTGGTITCTSFVDANGKRYSNRIPAIRLE
ncbi:CASH domain-dontaining protein [Candidatus Methanophagaceae archaeon]|nr:CASH domain-dontaining protein [Methanophagales archaeon]